MYDDEIKKNASFRLRSADRVPVPGVHHLRAEELLARGARLQGRLGLRESHEL